MTRENEQNNEQAEDGLEIHTPIKGVSDVPLGERFIDNVGSMKIFNDKGELIDEGRLLHSEKTNYGRVRIGLFRRRTSNTTGRVRDESDFERIRARRKNKRAKSDPVNNHTAF